MEVQRRLFSSGKVNSLGPSGLHCSLADSCDEQLCSFVGLRYSQRCDEALGRCFKPTSRGLFALWGGRDCAVPRAGVGRGAGEQRSGDCLCAGGVGGL